MALPGSPVQAHPVSIELRRETVNELVLKAEKGKKVDSDRADAESSACNTDLARPEAQPGTQPGTQPGSALSIESLAALLNGLPRVQPQTQEPPEEPEPKKRRIADQAKEAEKARVKAEQEAKNLAVKAAKEEEKAVNQARKAATAMLSLAAKVQVVLGPLALELKAAEKDKLGDAPEAIADPVKAVKDTVAGYLKKASEIIAASKKKDFATSGLALGFNQADITVVTTEAKHALKKLAGYQQLLA